MTTYYNDLDPYCCKVLSKNIERGYLPKGYIDGRDIRTVSANELMGYRHIHLFAGIGGFPLGMARAGYPLSLRTITGGFPCQDISLAGKGAGIEGERSGLWKEMYRLICALRPDYVCVENVAALLNRGVDTVLGDLAQSGYDAEWQVLRASEFGAPHIRQRIFLVAYPNGERQQERNITPIADHERYTCWRDLAPTTEMAHATSTDGPFHLGSLNQKKCQEVSSRSCSKAIFDRRRQPARSDTWRAEPAICRVADGIPARVDRLRALGNAIVPQCAEYVARSIMAYEMEREAVA